MIHFTPTLGIFATVKNIYNFIFNNQTAFWKLIAKVAPVFIVMLVIFTATMYLQLKPTLEQHENNAAEAAIGNAFKNILIVWILFQLVVFYLSSAIAISWHRLVIHGHNNYEPMKLLKPKMSEFIFILMLIAVSLLTIIPMIITTALFTFIFSALDLGPLSIFPGVLIGYALFLFLILRCSFYFPSKATGKNLTLGQSFTLSKGYVIKLFISNVIAIIPVYLLMILIDLVIGSVINSLNISALTKVNDIISAIITFLLAPFMTVIGVTVLSNYYQHALQNKGLPEAKSAADD